MLYVQISIVILCLTSYQILYSSIWNIYVQEAHEIILAWTVYTQVISTKIILFIMHSCILLNLHVTPLFLSKVGCSDCRNILWCSQESQYGGAILWYLELVLDVLSFVYIKQKWCICLNSLLCYYVHILMYFVQTVIKLWLLSLPLGGLVYSVILQRSTILYYWSSQPKKFKNQNEEREKRRKNFILLLVGSC